uniref:Las1-like family protein n=1 Tax=Rhizophora mucronata TaxID=61149 RepID=A0A2P2J955_RHIMU
MLMLSGNVSVSSGSKKQVTKTLKSLLHLHSSFSSEVLAVLLEFLKEALDASNLVGPREDDQLGQDMHNLLDDWKPVITKFTRKEPKVLPMLLNAVLNMIETLEVTKYDTGACISCLDSRAGTGQMEQLCSLFSWLIGQLEALKPLLSKAENEVSTTGTKTLKAILMEVLQKCLLLLPFGDKQLLDSVLHLAQLMGYTSLIEKLNKLSLPGLSGSVGSIENSFPLNPHDLVMQDKFIDQASKKLELVKLHPKRSKSGDTRDHGAGSSGRWTVAKSWNQCPIGMLPHGLGSSGCLPVLVCNDDDHESSDSSKMKQALELKSLGDTREAGKGKTLDGPCIKQSNRKREVDSDAYQLGELSTKKTRESVEDSQLDGKDALLPKGVKGHLMMNGIWQKVGEEELLTIKSGVRILV